MNDGSSKKKVIRKKQRANKAGKNLQASEKTDSKKAPKWDKGTEQLQEIRGFPFIEDAFPMTPAGMRRPAIKGGYGGVVREMLGLGYLPEEVAYRLQTDGGLKPADARWLVEIISVELAAAADIPTKKAYQMVSQSALTLFKLAVEKEDIPAAVQALKLFSKVHGLDQKSSEQTAAKDWIEATKRMETLEDIAQVFEESLAIEAKEGRLLDDEHVEQDGGDGPGRLEPGGEGEEDGEDPSVYSDIDVYPEGSGETPEDDGL